MGEPIPEATRPAPAAKPAERPPASRDVPRNIGIGWGRALRVGEVWRNLKEFGKSKASDVRSQVIQSPFVDFFKGLTGKSSEKIAAIANANSDNLGTGTSEPQAQPEAPEPPRPVEPTSPGEVQATPAEPVAQKAQEQILEDQTQIELQKILDGPNRNTYLKSGEIGKDQAYKLAKENAKKELANKTDPVGTTTTAGEHPKEKPSKNTSTDRASTTEDKLPTPEEENAEIIKTLKENGVPPEEQPLLADNIGKLIKKNPLLIGKAYRLYKGAKALALAREEETKENGGNAPEKEGEKVLKARGVFEKRVDAFVRGTGYSTEYADKLEQELMNIPNLPEFMGEKIPDLEKMGKRDKRLFILKILGAIGAMIGNEFMTAAEQASDEAIRKGGQ